MRARDEGELRVYRLGERRFCVDRNELLAWIRSHAVVPTSHARARLQEVLAREARKCRADASP